MNQPQDNLPTVGHNSAGAGELMQPNQSQGMFNVGVYGQIKVIASDIALSATIPDTLRGRNKDETMANLIPVLEFAYNVGFPPISVIQCTAIVRGKICYEGKLIHAVLIANNVILDETYNDESGEKFGISLKGTVFGVEKEIIGTVEQWHTKDKEKRMNHQWKSNPRAMLKYRGTREFARQYAPHLMLGVYSIDEMEDEYRAQTAKPVNEVLTPKQITKGAEGFQKDPDATEIDTKETAGGNPSSTGSSGEGAATSANVDEANSSPNNSADNESSQAGSALSESDCNELFKYAKESIQILDMPSSESEKSELLKKAGPKWVNGKPEGPYLDACRKMYSDMMSYLHGNKSMAELTFEWSALIGKELVE